MTAKHRLAALALAASVVTGTGLASATSAQGATMVKKSFTVVKSGYPTLYSCMSGESATASWIRSIGGTGYAGDSCGWWGSTRKYGFSITYWRWVPKAS